MSKKLYCVAALAAAILVLPAAAGDEGEATNPAPADPAGEMTAAEAAAMPAGTEGLRVYRDEKSGKLRAPTAAERAALAKAVKGMTHRSTAGLVERTLANGAVAVDLQGRFRNVAVATLDADGGVDFDCVASDEAAAALAEETADESSEEQDDE